MQVTAAVSRNAGAEFQLEQLKLEEPRDHEVLVRVVAVGVCHTDIAARDQLLPSELPVVLGHEGAGIVEQVGAGVTAVKPGDHVVMSFTSCGACEPCEHDHHNYCQQFAPLNFVGMRGDGSKAFIDANGNAVGSHFFGQSSFGSYALAQENNVVKVRDDAPLELLGPLGCGIQTGAGTFMRAFGCESGAAVAVTGGGAVGLSAVLGAVVQGCNPIIVVEPHANRREMALSLGATHAIDPMAGDLVEQLRAIAPNGLNYALDTTGKAAVISSLVASMGAGGEIGFVGVPSNPDDAVLKIDVLNMLLCGIKVKGICEGDANPAEFIPVMVDLFMDGKFPFDKLCQFYDFENINEAVEAQHRGECVKAILKL
ncbi:NAD(P)-dependent alcohol dehydrogenase [Spongiibacter sp. UBA1325]|jgi:aryl-alcohol dehydrogenase|uniref:NAD(P)-dependent alcohol dehydrogenase n=1 Tax=Spongiibacter sp. UBA1325 TaxID=1947543 RepID=UPI00257C4DCA|nr:NAD(P)-dependent alcohol dehydrogenase [Spongiibacter sp. UBA1325]|tara:strand:+ start:4597 stop:5703 length:1107 start_codon:yes stop_codon:yes gene_type:complete